MAKEERLRYIIETMRKGQRVTAQAVDDLEKVGDSAKTATGKLDALKDGVETAGKVFGAFAGGAAIAYRTLKEGADLGRVRGEFDLLSDSIGASDGFLADLKDSTRGFLTDAEAMALGSDLINTGLAQTEEKAVRLASVVGGLGIDMNQLTLTMLNDSEMRLDQMKLSAERVAEIQETLEREGFVGDAFDEAVLLAAEEKMEIIQDSTNDTAGAMQRVSVHAENIKGTLLEIAAIRTEGIFGGVANTLDLLIEDVDGLKKAEEVGLITHDYYKKALLGIVIGGRETREVINNLGEAARVAASETAAADGKLSNYITTIDRGGYVGLRYADSIKAINDLYGSSMGNYYAEQAMAVSEAANAATNELIKTAEAVEDLDYGVYEASDEVGGLHGKLIELEGNYQADVDIAVYGINTLARAQAMLNSLGNFNQGWDDTGEIGAIATPGDVEQIPGENGIPGEGGIVDPVVPGNPGGGTGGGPLPGAQSMNVVINTTDNSATVLEQIKRRQRQAAF